MSWGEKFSTAFFSIFFSSVVSFHLPEIQAAEPTLFSEQEMARKIEAHLVIRDPYSAVNFGKEALLTYPESKTVRWAYLKALCSRGDEIEALRLWNETASLFPEESKNRHLLETLAWGVLEQGEYSTQLPIQLNALLGASFTRDAQAIPILVRHLHSSNALLRTVAIRLASQFGDQVLHDELFRMLESEKVWYVRVEVIKAIGMMKMEQARFILEEMISNRKTLAEEKAAALIALVQIYEEIGTSGLERLIQSDRAGLRELACEIVAHLDAQDKAELLLPLLKDANPEVRMSVLVTLGLLQTEITELIRPRLDDTSPQVAIAAGWALLTKGDKEGENALKNWVLNGEPEWQRMASAAVSKTGKNGVNLCLLLLKKTKDPFVRVNLAMGLIGQRKEVPLASKVLFEALKTKSSEFWMWDSSPHPLFRTLAPSRVKHIEQIPNYPQVVDQMTSLDLLSVLSITKHPKAQESVKNFLRNQAGEVVGAAASSLLEEGDEEAFECVRELLFDSEPEIRFQAAYILAVHAGDREALKVLVEAYPTVDREKKVHILEAVAHIGDPETIAFLIDVLHEPFQVLRVVAASALIQCLYH